ncbi:MAG: DUF1326 domain-containing protein [Thermomicrobiales bacterium]
MGYQLEGSLLEVCDCNILCPCWVGEDPDGGTCAGVVAWHVDRGSIDGVDVSGRTIAMINHIPGNIFQGNWRVVFFVDDGATPAQHEALANAFTGKLGGPAADLSGLFGEVVAVERAPITHTVQDGRGTLKIGSVVDAELAPFTGPENRVTTLNDSVFSTIPGSPAYVGKAAHYRRKGSQYGLKDIDLRGHNAIQGSFRFEA